MQLVLVAFMVALEKSWKQSELSFANRLLGDHYGHCQQFLLGIACALRDEMARLQDRSGVSESDQCDPQDPIDSAGALTEDNEGEGYLYADWARTPELSRCLSEQKCVNPFPIFGVIEPPIQSALFARTCDDADSWSTDGLSLDELANFP